MKKSRFRLILATLVFVTYTTLHAVDSSLWTGSGLPKTSEAEVLEGVHFHVIKKYERKVDGYGFLHGVALA